MQDTVALDTEHAFGGFEAAHDVDDVGTVGNAEGKGVEVVVLVDDGAVHAMQLAQQGFEHLPAVVVHDEGRGRHILRVSRTGVTIAVAAALG